MRRERWLVASGGGEGIKLRQAAQRRQSKAKRWQHQSGDGSKPSWRK